MKTNYMYGRIIKDAMDEIATLRAENARDERGDLGPLTTLLAECADLRDRASAAEAENARLVKERAGLLMESIQHGGYAESKIIALRAEIVALRAEVDNRRNREVQNAYNDGYSSGFDAGKEGE